MADESTIDLGIAGITDAREVARGGFATVYRARQPMLDRIVAVKLIHGTVVDPLGGDRFLREIRATGRLSQHPNVAPVFDVGTTPSKQPYLIMPFYSNGSLARRIETGGPMAEPQAVHIGRVLAKTLAYVHDHGVLHRDVKPANVLLSDSNEPLLCDFGVARLTDASVALHTTGTSVVTWAYGPPEAFTGGEATPAWDVYSLAATIYAMLTGSPPFVEGDDVNVFSVLNRIGNVEVPDLRERGVSPALAEAIRRAMAKSPTDRPASAAEFAALLDQRPARRVQSPAPAPAWAPPPVPPPTPPPPAPPRVAETPAAEPPPPAPVEPPAPDLPRPERPLPVMPAATPSTWRATVWFLVPAVAGAILTLAGAAKPMLGYAGSEGYALGPTSVDLQLWVAPAIVLAAVALAAWPGVAAEWVIGAGITMLVLNFTVWTEFIVRRDEGIGVASLVLRSVGAGLVLLAVVNGWRRGAQPGNRLRIWHAVVLTLACAGTWLAIGDYLERFADYFGQPRTVTMLVASVGLVVLFVRAVALRKRTTAGAALLAAGLSGAIYWAAEISWLADEDVDLGDGPAMALAGFVVIAALGAVRSRHAASPEERISD